jgi:probable F420-dependent oxidoreductase
VRDWAQAAEDLGFDHIVAFDHVLGASTANRPDWTGPYTSESLFHEVMVLFGYLAAITRRVELVTSILILPQRQTALVAKQAAEVDVLSGGRLRLGIGVGWNPVEFEALGRDFHTRGAQCDEQIAVLRALWADPVISFDGKWHTITEAGLNPLPTRRSIPIWIGGSAEAVVRRVGRLADGWIPQSALPHDRVRSDLDRIRAIAAEAGRSPDAIGLEGRIRLHETPAADLAKSAQIWRDLGATHLYVNTMNAGLATPQAHVDTLHDLAQALIG